MVYKMEAIHKVLENSTSGDAAVSKAVIEIKGLHKSFGDNHVLRGFDLTMREGESVVILGQSGCGKSVLIKCIVGLIKPDAGSLSVLGEDILNLSTKDLDLLRIKIGFLFQNNALYDSMTVRQNLKFPMRRLWMSKTAKQTEEMVEEALENVGLLDAIGLMPSELSGGMSKRIGLARTLIRKPKIILYDEPTTGLDPITGREINNLMLKVHKIYNTSSIIISHDMDCVRSAADRIVILMDGINYAEGTYEELENSDDPRVSTFFNE